MDRYLVINPALAWIQGDVMASSANDAVARVERALSTETENDTWEVFRAPAGFPGTDYRGGDAELVALVRRSDRPDVIPNGRFDRSMVAFAMAS